MSEIALVSSRRARLTQLVDEGHRGAARALELSADPTRFLSTVQVGITSIGILSGAVGESAIADRLTVVFETVPLLAPYARPLSLVTMVVVLTYVSLILGELVPKRLGLTHPERFASLKVLNGGGNEGRAVIFLDAALSFEEDHARLSTSPHTVLPLCRGGLDDVIGFVRSTDILSCVLRGAPVQLTEMASVPLFVPRTVTLMSLLQQFRQAHLTPALVVDEFGGVVGLVSLTDVTAAIVGECPTGVGEDPSIVRRQDGTLLVDGALDIEQLKDRLDAELVDETERRQYHTLGGLAMFALGRVPRVGDLFERDRHRFEIVDMDGNRVDRLLVSRVASEPGASAR